MGGSVGWAPSEGAVPEVPVAWGELGRLVFEGSAVPMVVIDDGFGIREANPAAAALLGVAGPTSRSMLELLVAEPDRQLAAFLAGGPALAEWQTVLGTVPGRRLRVRVGPGREISGRRLRLVQLSDVTGSGDRERALAASELRYRQVVDNMPGLSVLTFDRDLRVQIAAGEALNRDGFAGDAMTGRFLDEVMPAPVMARLGAPFRATLDGRSSDFGYRSPVDGRQFRLRVRPLLGPDGAVIGGLSLGQDVSAEMARLAQLEHLQRLGNVGGCWYDAASGWTFDREMLHLLGADSAAQGRLAMGRISLPDDRAGDPDTGYLGFLTRGGRRTVQARMTHRERARSGTCSAPARRSSTRGARCCRR